jgi:hypothetical protein
VLASSIQLTAPRHAGSLGGQVSGEGWHSNWVFVPDYYYGYAPYVMWTAGLFAALKP